jgi:hypothetical protein
MQISWEFEKWPKACDAEIGRETSERVRTNVVGVEANDAGE